MLPSICLYTLVLFAAVFGAITAEMKKDKRILWLVIALLALFSGFRGSRVGIDTQVYIEKIGLIANGRSELAYGLEAPFKLICYLLTRINKSPYFALTVFALIINSCVLCRFWDLRGISSLRCMLACYYMAYFFISLNVTRQFCAVAIIFYGTRYLEMKKPIRYCAFVAAAMLFHRSAAVGFLLAFFEVVFWRELSDRQRKFYRISFYLMPLILIAAVLVLKKYWKYISLDTLDIGLMVPVKLLFFFATFLLVFVVYQEHCFSRKKLRRMQKCHICVLLIASCYFFGICASFLGYISYSAGRIAWYFLLFEGPYLGMLLKTKGAGKRGFFKICVAVMMGHIYLHSILSNSQGTIPYTFMWQ